MNPMIITMLGSLLRAVLLGWFATLIERGIWTQDQVELLAIGIAGFVATWGWALWKHYRSRLKFLTALESPVGTTEAAINEKVKTGAGASLTRALLLVLVGGSALTGCGPKTKPTLVKVDSGIYQSVRALSETAKVLGRSQVITPQQELKIQEAILPVTILGEQATRVLAAWTSGPTPAELQRLVAEMAQLTRKIIEILPGESKGKATLLESIAFVQQAIATALIITGSGGVS